jgi:hypothetical protein
LTLSHEGGWERFFFEKKERIDLLEPIDPTPFERKQKQKLGAHGKQIGRPKSGKYFG